MYALMLAAALAAPAAEPDHVWVYWYGHETDYVLLETDRRVVGCWDYNRQEYRTYDEGSKQWGEPIKAAPLQVPPQPTRVGPAPAPQAAPAGQGVVREERTPGSRQDYPKPPGYLESYQPQDNVYTMGGTVLAKDEALKLVDVPNDRSKPWLVVVGDERFRATETARLSPVTEYVRLQEYAPGDPVGTRDRDGRVVYPPGVYVISPDANVLGSWPGPVYVNDVAKAVRKSIPVPLMPGEGALELSPAVLAVAPPALVLVLALLLWSLWRFVSCSDKLAYSRA